MKPEQHVAHDSPNLSPRELEAIFKVARQQAEAHDISESKVEEVDWRLLVYVALGAALLVLVVLQMAG